MQRVFPSDKKKFNLEFNVATSIPTNLKIQAYDKNKPFSFYYNTAGKVDYKGRTFDLKFPISPDQMVIQVYPDKFGNYDEFRKYANPKEREIKITGTSIKALKTYPMWFSQGDLEFIKFAEWFCNNAGILSGTNFDRVPSIYKSSSGKYEIDYFNVIQNKDGSYVSTPARIGQKSGIIEVSKRDFLTYTIPGRMAILLHEYCHKYVNPKTGLKPTDEIGADINALNIYLSLGYSPVEAHMVFLQVFKTANSDLNHKRYVMLNDFIQKFLSGGLRSYYKPERAYAN